MLNRFPLSQRAILLILTTVGMAAFVGCSLGGSTQNGMVGHWEGIDEDGAPTGLMLEFKGKRFVYTHAETDFRSSGKYSADETASPKLLKQTTTSASSSETVTAGNPAISYSIYSIEEGVLKIAYGLDQREPALIPTSFELAYHVDTFRRPD